MHVPWRERAVNKRARAPPAATIDYDPVNVDVRNWDGIDARAHDMLLATRGALLHSHAHRNKINKLETVKLEKMPMFSIKRVSELNLTQL